MDLERLFYPRSVAVVGASPNLGDGKIPYYQILQGGGYAGQLYPVNPSHREIGGVKVYPSLLDLPEAVDLAIVSVPNRAALATLELAVKKGVKFVHFFTAGFSESGNTELEASLVAALKGGETRVVGPNCIGVHCSEVHITFDWFVKPAGRGTVAFIGQSGGVTNNFVRICQARGIALNKAVSYGNQIDLRVEDFLDYFLADDTVKVAAAYIEDIKNGRAFVDVLRRFTKKKPLIVLKGGVTAAGARAAASHTGALAGRQEIWSAAMRQHRVIEVETQEELLDAVMLAASEKIPAGSAAGFLGAGGGTSVLFTDLAVRAGLRLPELAPATQDRIAERIPRVNTSTANPVDLGAWGIDYRIMEHTMRAMAADPNLDVIIPFFSLDFAGIFGDEQNESGFTNFTAAARAVDKPVVPIIFRSTEDNLDLERLRVKIHAIFRAAGLPVYRTPQDAVAAVRNLLRWRGLV